MFQNNLPRKCLVVDYDNLYSIDLPIEETFNLVVFKEGVKCDFIIHFKRNTDKLIVLGSDVTPRDDIKINPYYDKFGWNFKYSTIFYNDPSSYESDEIYGAWGVGTKEKWYLEIISSVIKRIVENVYDYNSNNKYKNIIFCGSSQGGFMSFMLSVLLKNSLCIADMPQTDIFKGFDFSIDSPLGIYKESILDYLFNQKNIDEIYARYGHRLSFVELMKKEQYVPNAYLYFNFNDWDFENQCFPFFEKLNQLPYGEESSNSINIFFNQRKNKYNYMSEKDFLKVIDNIILINENQFDFIPYKNKIEYHIVDNKVKLDGVIRFYGFDSIDFNELSVSFEDKLIRFTDLDKGFSKTLGLFYDFPAKHLGVGIHEVCLKYKEQYSNLSKIFVKDVYNVLDFNIWVGSDCEGIINGFNEGQGQYIESSDEWSFLGERSIRITHVGDSFVWTDLPINNINEGDLIKVSGAIESKSNASIFFVFVDNEGNQSFSNGFSVKPFNTKKFYIEKTIVNNIKEAYLRFKIKDGIGSSMFVDNLKIIIRKKNIAIHGSCSSDCYFTSFFNSNFKKEYNTLINFTNCSLISTMNNGIFDNSFPNMDSKIQETEFSRDCLVEEGENNFIKRLVTNPIDYLIIDIYSEVDKGISCNNTNKNKKTMNMINNPDEFYPLWKECCDKFFDFLKSNCPNTKVVLMEIKVVYKVLGDDGKVYVDEKLKKIAEIYNPLIIELENYIKENYDVFIIPFDDDIICVEENGQIYYQEKFYTNISQYLSEIIKFEKLL